MKRRDLISHLEAGGASVHPQIRSAQQYVREHHFEALPLGRVAGAVHLGQYYFSRLFRRSVGLPFRDFVAGIRVERAEKLLRAVPRRSITEIAYAVGFGTLRSFELQFKRLTGMTPSAYRRRGTAP
ncbi:MAG: helix-turn-helix transcriptional regulator [Gemmatimonadetes bacterium]|nr:helix-turn-helix transcriptional regulator [Gemmatimonadota bacterium]